MLQVARLAPKLLGESADDADALLRKFPMLFFQKQKIEKRLFCYLHFSRAGRHKAEISAIRWLFRSL